MSKNQRDAARLQILKGSLVAGGTVFGLKGLPDRWSAPVVEKVMLPAHATTNPLTFGVSRKFVPIHCTPHTSIEALLSYRFFDSLCLDSFESLTGNRDRLVLDRS